MGVRKTLTRSASIVFLVPLLLGLVTTTGAEASPNGSAANSPSGSALNSEFDNQDAKYAAEHDVSMVVAAERRAEAEKFATLVADAGLVHGESNVDAWVETGSQRQVFHLRSTSPSVVKALRGTTAASGLRVVVATEALSLADRTTAVAAQVKDISGVDGYYVDVATGQPVIFAPADAVAGVAATASKLMPSARVESSGDGGQDENRGGLNLTGCTSGFAATWSGYRGFFTAAHCTGTQSWQPAGSTTWNTSIGALTQVHNGTADIAFRAISSSPNTGTIYNNMWTGSGYATISSGSGVAVVGTTYCGRGKTSGYRCAQVTSTSYTPTYAGACPGGCGANFVLATLTAGGSAGGDSGGPWANGNTAVGIHKGSASATQVIWSKIGFRPASSNVFTG